jgi:transcriptional regulator with XRE-family HTH domain
MEIQVGGRIRELRREKGFSQAELARRLDVAPATVYRWESGTREISLTMLSQVAEKLDTELSEFFPKAQASLFQPEEEQRRTQDTKPPPVTVELGPQELRAAAPDVDVELKAHVIDFIRKNVNPTLSDEEALEEAVRRLGAA